MGKGKMSNKQGEKGIRKEEFFRKRMRNGLTYVEDETTPFTGIFVFKYGNGKIKEYEPFVNGIKEGVHEKFYENGNVKETNTFVNGSLNGDSIQFYENGNMKESMVFMKDKFDGEWVKYYDCLLYTSPSPRDRG